MPSRPAIAVADDPRRQPVAGVERARFGDLEGLGMRDVAVGGVRGGVHPAPDDDGALGQEPGLRGGAGGLRQAMTADGDHLARLEALTRGHLDHHAGGPGPGGERREYGTAQHPSQGGHPYRPALHAEDLRIRLHSRGTPENPGRGIFPPRLPRYNAGIPAPGGRTPGPGRSANLNAHPFGGGVIGNTTGSGPVIEGSSPSPRAPAVSTRVVETIARPHRLEA